MYLHATGCYDARMLRGK